MKRVLIIDNYDSFVYNIYQYVAEIEPEGKTIVYRNDAVSIDQIKEFSPTHIIISPGPGRPESTGITKEVIKHFYKNVPILGICLGHQTIGEVFGAKIIHAGKIMHGKTSVIHHTGTGIFKGVVNPFTATRYHSLAIEKESLPASFAVTAKSDEDAEIMGIQHKDLPVYGVQFHPESILTAEGKKILKNFLEMQAGEKMSENPVISSSKTAVIVEGLHKLFQKKDLTEEETCEIMNEIMSGKATDAQIAGFLTALRMKGEAGQELAGMAKVMQNKSVYIAASHPKTVDTCGTGGDGAGTFNISTTTAFVVCSAGLPVAKHGNRSVSSRVGSADVLEAGGYILQKTPKELEDELKTMGFAFLFAPLLHPAMKSVMPARRQLKSRTAFNLLGPLTNPARVKYQIVGIFDFEYAPRMAAALQAVGTKKSFILSGGFTDELTTCGENRALMVDQEEVTPFCIEIEKLSLHPGKMRELQGQEDPKRAFWVMQQILGGKGNQTQTETVALNAGALFFITGETETVKKGVEKAMDILSSGEALKKVEEVLQYQKEKRI